VRTPAHEHLSRALSSLTVSQDFAQVEEVEEAIEETWSVVNVRGHEASVEATVAPR